jgi:hypothetical protein
MDQTSLTDIPFDVKSYCREVGNGLSDEQIALMARPKKLTPMQHEVMYWHEKLYHLPFHRLIALAKKGILPSRLSKCRNNAPPKWDPRSGLGIYLGHCPMHAGSVVLILNPTMGHVSPQCYVTYDDSFETVQFMRDGFKPPTWEEMCKNSTELATEEQFDLAEIWMSNESNKTPDLLMAPSKSSLIN